MVFKSLVGYKEVVIHKVALSQEATRALGELIIKSEGWLAKREKPKTR